MLFTYFYFMHRKKKRQTCSYLQLAANTLALNPQLFCQQIYKNNPLCFGSKYVFFIGAAKKNICFSELACNSIVLLLTQLMICSLRFKKDNLILKCCFEFCAFRFEAIPHPKCYLISIVDKTHHGTVIAPFCVQDRQLFQLPRRCLSNQTFFAVID